MLLYSQIKSALECLQTKLSTLSSDIQIQMRIIVFAATINLKNIMNLYLKTGNDLHFLLLSGNAFN